MKNYEEINIQLLQKDFFIYGSYTQLLNMVYKGETIEISDSEWKVLLNEWHYFILRRKGTERAFTGKYYQNKEKGIYLCSGCGLPLFDSSKKYESFSGWPSFFEPLKHPDDQALRIREEMDISYGMIRVEILCARCGGHLGHVFTDGPPPTHLRYCVNSASLYFVNE